MALDLSLWVGGVPVPILGVAGLGVFVGYVAGMFGIGGGFIITPMLVGLYDVPLRYAVGSGLCQVIGTALVSYLRHRRVRQGEVRFDLAMLPGSLLGVSLGARLHGILSHGRTLHLGAHEVPWVDVILEVSYVALLLGVAWVYLRRDGGRVDVLRYVRPGPFARARLGPGIDLPSAGLHGVSAMLIAYIGLGLGLLSGLLGVGGGVALNPVLLYGFGFPMRQAVGTGIVVVFVTAIVGTAVHAAQGHVHLGLVMVLLLGSTVSAQFGALQSRRLSGRTLGRLQAVVVLGAAVAVLWDLSRHVR